MKIVYVKSINEYIDAIKNNNEVIIVNYFYDGFIKYIIENKTTYKLNELFYNFYIASNKIKDGDVSVAISFLEKATFDSENKDACYFLGCVYKYNEELLDYEKANNYFNKAIEYGSLLSLYELGEMYYYGKGVTQSYEEAAKWFKRATDNNYASAQNSLGLMILKG